MLVASGPSLYVGLALRFGSQSSIAQILAAVAASAARPRFARRAARGHAGSRAARIRAARLRRFGSTVPG